MGKERIPKSKSNKPKEIKRKYRIEGKALPISEKKSAKLLEEK